MEQKYCSNCGAELNNEVEKCSNCGFLIQKNKFRQREKDGVFANYKEALKRYADIKGRTTLREFWNFFSANLIVVFLGGFALYVFSVFFGLFLHSAFITLQTFMLIAGGYLLYIIIPSIAISIRRLHDQGKSALWYFIILVPYLGVLVLLVLMSLKGTLGPNKYGEPSEY